MGISRSDLDPAVAAGVLTDAQADAVWKSVSGPALPEPAPEPRAANPLRASAVLVAAVASSAIATGALFLVWERFGAAAACVLAIWTGAALLRVAAWLAVRRYEAALGALTAAAVAMAAVATHALQHWLGLASHDGAPSDTLLAWLTSHGFPAALAAVVAAALAVRVFSVPFLSAVLVAALWFLVMDAAPLAFGENPSWGQHALLSSLLGLVAIGAGLALDGRARSDHAFWLYLSGLIAFWGGVATNGANSEGSLALGAFVNGSLVFVSLVLRRRTFAIFGAIGLAAVASHLAARTLVEEVVPFVLASVGLLVAAGAIAYHRFEAVWSRAVVDRFPGSLRRLLPPVVAGR